jgi:hypothetical protein
VGLLCSSFGASSSGLVGFGAVQREYVTNARDCRGSALGADLLDGARVITFIEASKAYFDELMGIQGMVNFCQQCIA